MVGEMQPEIHSSQGNNAISVSVSNKKISQKISQKGCSTAGGFFFFLTFLVSMDLFFEYWHCTVQQIQSCHYMANTVWVVRVHNMASL